MKYAWYKILTVVLLLYTFIGGFFLPVPRLPILYESIRNTYFHIPMWFGMMIIFTASAAFSGLYLRQPNDPKNDLKAESSAEIGLLFGILGTITGALWAKYTWGEYWSGDPKQNATAIFLLIYSAYFVLRGSFDGQDKKARISAVYNLFAYATMIPLLFILPRLTDSLHPGNGGNPGFGKYDMDNTMRLVFYPAIVAWTLLGVWIIELKVRIKTLNTTQND